MIERFYRVAPNAERAVVNVQTGTMIVPPRPRGLVGRVLRSAVRRDAQPRRQVASRSRRGSRV